MSARVFAILTVAVIQSAACGQSTPLSAKERERAVELIANAAKPRFAEIEAAIERVKSAKVNPSLRSPFLPASKTAVWQFPSQASKDEYIKKAESVLAEAKKNFLAVVPPMASPFGTGAVGRLENVRISVVHGNGLVTFWVPDRDGDIERDLDSAAGVFLTDTKGIIEGKRHSIPGIWVASDAIELDNGKKINSFKPLALTAAEVEKITGGR